MNSLPRVVLFAFLTALIPGVLIGWLVSLIHHDFGIYLGIFVAGLTFGDILDSIESYPVEEEDEE